MAIKKISFNKEGLVSEETIEKKVRKTPPPEPKKTRKTAKTSRKGSAKGTDAPKVKPVKITSVADKKKDVPEGKSLIEQNVIKFKCPRCSSERISDNLKAKLKCGLCGAEMRHQK